VQFGAVPIEGALSYGHYVLPGMQQLNLINSSSSSSSSSTINLLGIARTWTTPLDNPWQGQSVQGENT